MSTPTGASRAFCSLILVLAIAHAATLTGAGATSSDMAYEASDAMSASKALSTGRGGGASGISMLIPLRDLREAMRAVNPSSLPGFTSLFFSSASSRLSVISCVSLRATQRYGRA